MKRTPLCRKTPLRPGKPSLRRSRLRRQSPRQAKRLRQWTKSRRTAFAACGGACVVRVSPDCTGRAECAHHRMPRRFGDDTARNLIPCCVQCHSFLHRYPAEAVRLGFIVRGNSEARRGTGTADADVGVRTLPVSVDAVDCPTGTHADPVSRVFGSVGREPAVTKGPAGNAQAAEEEMRTP